MKLSHLQGISVLFCLLFLIQLGIENFFGITSISPIILNLKFQFCVGASFSLLLIIFDTQLMSSCCQGSPQHLPPDTERAGGHQPPQVLPGAPLPRPEPGQAPAQARGRLVSSESIASDLR